MVRYQYTIVMAKVFRLRRIIGVTLATYTGYILRVCIASLMKKLEWNNKLFASCAMFVISNDKLLLTVRRNVMHQ